MSMATELQNCTDKLLANKELWQSVSDDTGISTKTLYRIATGRTDPAYSNVSKILAWFRTKRLKPRSPHPNT